MKTTLKWHKPSEQMPEPDKCVLAIMDWGIGDGPNYYLMRYDPDYDCFDEYAEPNPKWLSGEEGIEFDIGDVRYWAELPNVINE